MPQPDTSGHDDLVLLQIAAGSMQNLVYVIGSRFTRQAALVDPAWDIEGLLAIAAQADLEVTHALVTHAHADHVGGAMPGLEVEGLAGLLAQRRVEVVVHRREADALQRLTGVRAAELTRVEGGDSLRLGEQVVQCLHTPGHTPGSLCFLVRDCLITGDTLFVGGCGRVDLPGGDAGQLYDSLHGVLDKLPDDTRLFPGHSYGGASGALGAERRSNLVLRASRPDWLRLAGGRPASRSAGVGE